MAHVYMYCTCSIHVHKKRECVYINVAAAVYIHVLTVVRLKDIKTTTQVVFLSNGIECIVCLLKMTRLRSTLSLRVITLARGR